MALTYGEGIYGNGAGVVTPLAHRMAQIGSYTKTATANLIRPGLLYNGVTSIVSGTGGMSYNVAAFSAVSTRGATQGAVPFANDAIANVATTAAPGSNSRYDVIYAWPRDFAIDGTNSNPVLGVVQGTAAASPTVPSLAAFPGAIELARVLVPAGVTATNSGTTFTQTAPFTSADGGLVPFRTKSEMDGWTTAITNQRARDLATGYDYFWTGTAWRQAAAYLEMTSTQSIANNSPSNVTTFTEVSDVPGWHDAVTNISRISPNAPGRYQIIAQGAWAANSTGVRYVALKFNGAVFNPRDRAVVSATVDGSGNGIVSGEYTFNGSSDYFEIEVYQTSGVSLALAMKLTVRYLGPS